MVIELYKLINELFGLIISCQQNYSLTRPAIMQFQNNTNTTFDKIVQNIETGGEGLYKFQVNNDIRPAFRGIGQMRQNNRTHRGDELVRIVENYQPKSDLINWKELKAKNSSMLKKYRESVYYGQIVDGKRDGLGVMLYTNGRVYQGHWKDNFKHGKGYEKFNNGATYSGSYSNGKPQGYGTYVWDNGETYEGQWIDGQKHGSGIWRGPNGDSYIGQWKQGQANGYGVHTWVNGDRYEGQFLNCLKHGEGIEKFANGDSYKGMYCSGKPEGEGQYYWAMGSFFKGNFKNGLRDGAGIWKRGPGNSDKYEGQYKQDKKQGFGVFVWQNGNVYKGNFVNDLRQGYGEMYFNNGSCFKGQWAEGQQVSGELLEPVQEERDFEQWAPQADKPRRQASQGTTRNRLRKDYHHLQRRTSNQQVMELGNDSFFEQQPDDGFFQQKNPLYLDADRRFRTRANSKKSNRHPLQSQRTAQTYFSSTSMGNTKMFTRNNVSQRETPQKKMKQPQSDPKMMSSSFFLYKIHGQGGDGGHMKARARMVKTSGGMRQKRISEEIRSFTRNKINPELF